MKHLTRSATLWVGLYALLTLAPVDLLLLGRLPPGRGFWVEFSSALGFVGLAMLAMQFILTARFQLIAGNLGHDTMLQFHRQAGIVAFILILAHPLIFFIAEPTYLEFLDPRVNLPRALALNFVTIALALLVILSLWRAGLGIAYEWWRLTHGILALMVVMIGLAHILMVGHYTSVLWKQGLWVLLIGGAMFLLFYVRLIKPLIMLRYPYRVAEVRKERGRSWTLALEPEGHAGMKFNAGQFAWLTLGNSPFYLRQHPFSFSSGPLKPGRLEFTIKELGDFTSTIGTVRPGDRAYLEGPFGAFSLDTNSFSRTVFIVGGIGITPIMSMLRDQRDRGSKHPMMLIYGNSRWDEICFREELQELQKDLDLRVIHVLAVPPDGWRGESGLIDESVLSRYLSPEDDQKTQYFVCGPDNMMNVAEQALLARGVPLRNVHTERFNLDVAVTIGKRQINIRRLVIALAVLALANAVLFAFIRNP